jgi:hypothetical protein
MKIYTLLDGDKVFYGSFDTEEKLRKAVINLQLENISVWSVPDDFMYKEALLNSQDEDEEVYELLMKRYIKYLKEQDIEDFNFYIIESELNETVNPEEY